MISIIPSRLTSHQTRVVTSLIGLAVLIAAFGLGGPFQALLIVAVSLVAQSEFYGLFWSKRENIRKTIGFVIGALVIFMASYVDTFTLLCTLLGCLWAENLAFTWSKKADCRPGFITTGVLYISVPLSFLMKFSLLESALILLLVMASDVGAYYCGMKVGGPKIWPRISPNKTWAGSIGGLVFCLLIGIAFYLAAGTAHLAHFLLLTCAVNIAAQLGDFYESALKRQQKVKDSGALLPGHGGFLDRIDGLLFALPVFYAFITVYPLFQ